MVSKRVLILSVVFLLVAIQLCTVGGKDEKKNKDEKKDKGKKDKEKFYCITQQANAMDKWDWWTECKHKCVKLFCEGKEMRGCFSSDGICKPDDDKFIEKRMEFVQKYGGGALKTDKDSITNMKCNVCTTCKPKDGDPDWCNGGPPPRSSQPRSKIVAGAGAMMLLGMMLKRALL